MEQRIAKLEEWRESVEQLLPEIRTDIKEAVRGISEIKVQMAGFVALPRCPKPGECLDLGENLTKLETRLRQLESERDTAKGGLRVLIATISLVGGTTGAILTMVIQHTFFRGP